MGFALLQPWRKLRKLKKSDQKENIRINAVCPGVIKTPMIDRFTGKDKAAEQQFVDMEPIGRMGEPEEVAEAVVWLCSYVRMVLLL